jgi:(p)ppGpp synthase/HD superfamily hydrolase
MDKQLESVEDALDFATQKHSGQFRRGGDSYISHPKAVADIVKQNKSSHKLDDLISAALLHDTIEDTEATFEEIAEKFGPNVASLVWELTSDQKEIERLGKTQYLQKKVLGISSWALVIKLSDRLHNLIDLETSDSKWAKKYALQTRAIIGFLKANRKLSQTHQKLIIKIEQIIDDYLR